MAINKWLGIAQPRVAVKAFQPTNVSPGTLWLLRVGGVNYQYTYAPSIVGTSLTDQERAKVVTDGLAEQFSGIGLGGGSTQIVESITSELVSGKWSLVARGTADGAPIDVEVSAVEATASLVKVVELQAGQAAQNAKQVIKWPKTPTAGNLALRYRDKTATVAYNASAATVASTVNTLAGAVAASVVGSGDYTTGYTLEFGGSLAGQDVDLLSAWSDNSVGTSSVAYEVTQRGGLARSRYAMTALNSDSEYVYQFEYEGEFSHYFTGASSPEQIRMALESISALAGNVDVSREQDGSFTIALVAALVGESAGELSVAAVGSEDDPPELTLTEGATDPLSTIQRIKLLNLPSIYGGTISFSYNGLTTSVLNIITMTLLDIQMAFSTSGFAWGVTALQKENGKPIIIDLESSSFDRAQDAGIVTATAVTVGCDAIEVRTIQKAKKPRNAIQQVALHSGPDGGTFTLSYGANTTAGLVHNASAATIQGALQGLASIGLDNAVVDGNDGGPWVVTFQGSLASTTVGLLTGNGASLTIVNAATATVADIQLPTGPGWWTNAKNWSQARVPISTDVVVFESGSVACQYGIDSGISIAGLDIYRSYTGRIGLAETRDDGSNEQLAQYLSLSNSGGKIAIRIGLGDEGDGPAIVRIDTGAQEADVSVLYSAQPTASSLYTIGLAGDLAGVQVNSASVIFSSGTGRVTTIDSFRFSPLAASSGDAIVEWGPDASVNYVEISGGVLRAGSVPAALIINGGDCSVRGAGDINQISVRNSRLRYSAYGKLGKQGPVTTIAADVNDQLLITSAAHGLVSGDLVFIRGVFAFADKYYVVSVVNANQFALVGSDAAYLAEGTLDESFFDSFFGGGEVPSGSSDGAKWGLADAVRIGVGGTIDFSELGAIRYAVAPLLLQSETAVIHDPLITIADLRWHSDPSFMDQDFGGQGVFKREQSVAVSYSSASYANSGGGVVGG